MTGGSPVVFEVQRCTIPSLASIENENRIGQASTMKSIGSPIAGARFRSQLLDEGALSRVENGAWFCGCRWVERESRAYQVRRKSRRILVTQNEPSIGTV